MVIVFQQKKKKKKKIFYHQRTKKSCVIEETKTKTKFFATTVNWYKYQFNYKKLLKIKYNILLRLYLFL